MVETLLDEEADDAVGVEDEVAAVGVFIADHARVGQRVLSTGRKSGEAHVRRAMSCGVWGRMWTFSEGISVDTLEGVRGVDTA